MNLKLHTGGTAQHGQNYSYGANWQMVSTQVSAGVVVTQKGYADMLGRNFKTEYADGSFSMNYYNAKSQVIRSVSPSGLTTLFEYDQLGRMIVQAVDMNGNNTIDAADLKTQQSYSYGTQSGKAVSITVTTKSQGTDSTVISTTQQSLDGLESWSIDMGGNTTHNKTERLGSGNTRQTVTLPDGSKTITNLTNGRVMTVQQVNSDNSLGNLSSYSYDEFNRVAGVVATNGNNTISTMTNTYNANGAVLSSTVNGQTTSFEYDVMGRQVKVTKPGNADVFTEYYPTGEVKKSYGADTYTTEYSYNGIGQNATLTTWQDADTPQVTSWTYSSRGFMTAKTYADGNSVTYTYNADGQLLTRTWARQVNGQPLVTTYSYDAAGRQTGYSYSDGTPGVTFTLNYLDHPLSVTDAAGVRNFSYNAQKQLANETNPSIVNGVQGYTYDAYGRRTGMTFGNGVDTMAQANYTYDTTGRIATVGNGADTLTYTYVPGTGMIQSAAWNSATLNTAYTYDQYKRLTDIHVNNTPVYGYELNAKNQRTGATLPDGKTWAYSYDALGQLTQAQKQDGATLLQNMLYNYDLIGNRTSATENSATTNYTSNLVNQYTQIAAQIPTYDADGNMTYYNGWNFTWNGENRMTKAENTTTGIRVEADYDYMGRRSYKKVYSNNTLTKHIKFVYDGYKLIAEFDALNNDTKLADYLWQPIGLDVPLMRNEEYYIADGNKNIIQLRDNSGAITKTYAYNPFGELETPNLSDTNPFRFSSEYHDDETTLVYYNFRYYSTLDGRWINRDPIAEQGGVNLYGMCQNNGICLIDIYGYSWWNPLSGQFFVYSGVRTTGKAAVAGGKIAWDATTWVAAQIGEGCAYTIKGTIKGSQYFFSDEALILGWLSGPLGDILSGGSKLLWGKKAGGVQMLNGSKRLGIYIVADIAGITYGNTYGKAAGFKWAYENGTGWGGVRNYLLPGIIPNMGNYGGANWGTSQQPLPLVAYSMSSETNFYPLLKVPTKIEYGSFIHDYDLDERRTDKRPSNSLSHMRWIKNVWGGEGVEPGPFGQSYRMIGTPAFLLFALIDR